MRLPKPSGSAPSHCWRMYHGPCSKKIAGSDEQYAIATRAFGFEYAGILACAGRAGGDRQHRLWLQPGAFGLARAAGASADWATPRRGAVYAPRDRGGGAARRALGLLLRGGRQVSSASGDHHTAERPAPGGAAAAALWQ